ncbi:IS110 family transposase [Sphingomonas sp. PAMC 26621]|uniref:IS110 family transposase n=1 Tax=Sphingomonas sp. PAMC 26621 TaxID=1112213 RepID=UPI000287B809|nr:IS110 family transposase [Sphingomonas sp. PAMC 26621]
MSLSTTQTAGIDIGKAYLDIALYPSGAALRLANDSEGHGRLLHWLIEHDIARVGLEASGGYERGVAEVLRDAGLEVALLQPRQVRAFAVFRLRRAKNDRLDAQLIAHCTAELDSVRSAPDPRLAPFAEHLRLIKQIEADLARSKTRNEAYRCPRLKRWLAQETTRLERRLKAELLLLTKTLSAAPDLLHRLTLIESVEGVGRRTALSLLILMPELGHLTRAEIASLAGLAPFDHESGKHCGQRRIAGGRHRVRRSLYAASLAASFRWNASLKALYQRLRVVAP